MPRNDPQASPARKYLIVGPSWIGDMVMAQSLFITLEQQYPGCVIDVLAPAWSLPVIGRMPQVRRGIAVPVEHGELAFFKRRALGKSLRAEGYTHAIVIPRSWKSALIPYYAGIAVRTGYRGEMRYGLLNDIRPLDKNILRQTVQRYVAHAWPPDPVKAPETPYPALTVDQQNKQKLLAQFQLKSDRPVACMMPGAEYGPAKQWPPDHYRQLAERLVAEGWQVWILGSAKDRLVGDCIAVGEHRHNLCGKTALVDTVDLLACATETVCNDSGLMHIAAAVGVKVHAIYGSSTPDYTPPLAPEGKRLIHYRRLACSPCFKRECPLGHTDCLKEISVDEVFQSIVAAH